MSNVTPVKPSGANTAGSGSPSSDTSLPGSPTTNEEKKKSTSGEDKITLRFDVNLKHCKGREVDYKSLVRNYLEEKNKDNINSSFYEKGSTGSSSLNSSISGLPNIDLPTLSTPKNRLTEVINKIEKIHANGMMYGDIEEDSDYDSDQDNDSFIDDTDAMDFDETLETELGGFFVNVGSIRYKDRSESEMDADNSYTNYRSSGSRYSAEEDDDDDEKDQEEEKKQSPPKKKKSSSDASKKPTKALMDIESPEIEQMVQELEKEIKGYTGDTKLLPKKIAPLLSKLYSALKSTNPQGYLPSSVLTRISGFWKLQVKTIKVHLKKAYLENENVYNEKLESMIKKLNEHCSNIKKIINSDMEDPKNKNKESTTPTKSAGEGEDKEEKPKDLYIFTRAAKEEVFKIVKLNKNIIDLKNANENESIVEKTSRLTLYKKIVGLFPTGWISSKSLSNAYTTIRTAERKQERKLEQQQQSNQEKQEDEKPKSDTVNVKIEKETKDSLSSPSHQHTSSSSNSNSNNKKPRENSENSDHKKHHSHSSSSSSKSSSHRDKEKSSSSSSGSSSSKKHHSSSNPSGSSSSSSSSNRDKDRDKEKEKEKERSSSSGGSRDKDKERHNSSREKKHSSSSSSSSSSKDKSRDKDRERKDRKRLLENFQSDVAIDIDNDILEDIQNYKKHKSSNTNSSSTTTTINPSNSPPPLLLPPPTTIPTINNIDLNL